MPLDPCLPGGSCPHCNPGPDYCRFCGDVEVEYAHEPCDDCARRLAEKEAEDDEAREQAREDDFHEHARELRENR